MKPSANLRTFALKSLLTVAGIALLAGCGTTDRQNRRIYDRYAELVAEKNRAAQAPAPAPAVAAPAAPIAPSRPETKPIPKPEPARVAAPKPAPPVQAPPVQVLTPAPKPQPPSSAPVKAEPVPAAPVPAAKPEPVSAPAPVQEAGPTVSISPAIASEAADPVAYSLKVGDVVQISLRGIPNAEAIEAIIDEHGGISLPFINEIKAAGQTASELSRSIRRIYQEQGIYNNISVNVVVPTRYYFMQGEIRSPGRFQIMSATRVSQAIAASGGYTEFASGRVEIKRGGKIYKTIRNAKRLDRTPDDDVLLEPDDIIEVRRSLW